MALQWYGSTRDFHNTSSYQSVRFKRKVVGRHKIVATVAPQIQIGLVQCLQQSSSPRAGIKINKVIV